MEKIVLSDVPLDDLLVDQTEVRYVQYGNRGIDYFFDFPKRNAFDRFPEKGKVVAVVCCRKSATLLAEMNYPQLKLVQLTSTGFDGVPIEKLAEKGIAVSNIRNIYNNSIAETVVYGFLCMAKRLHQDPKNHRVKLTRRYRCITELAGKKLLVMGCGSIGTSIVKRFDGLEMAVDGYNPFIPVIPPYGEMYSTREQLLENLKKYDYVVSTIPATEQTIMFCNGEFFEAMGQRAVFCNVGRADTVDEDALYRALKDKIIGGAVLDVVELLPVKLFHRFRWLKNTLVLPGIAANSQESSENVKRTLTQNIRHFLLTNEIRDQIH